jgi:hypothetical protein
MEPVRDHPRSWHTAVPLAKHRQPNQTPNCIGGASKYLPPLPLFFPHPKPKKETPNPPQPIFFKLLPTHQSSETTKMFFNPSTTPPLAEALTSPGQKTAKVQTATNVISWTKLEEEEEEEGKKEKPKKNCRQTDRQTVVA